MKTFFTFLFFYLPLTIFAQATSQSALQKKISGANVYLFFGAGITCSNDNSLNEFMKANNGEAISNVMIDARQMGMYCLSKKRNIDGHRLGMGFDIDFNARRYLLETPIYFELPPGKRTSRFISLNPMVERYAIYTNPPVNLSQNVTGGYYSSFGYAIGLSYHSNYFLNKNPQKIWTAFAGFDAGINFQLCHSEWDYGHTSGVGKQQAYYPALENVGLPAPGNITIYFRIHFGGTN